MRVIDGSLVEFAAQLLERDEREAVLGDLLEARESLWQGVPDVLGLVLRRQVILWKNWRPWLAAFGIALPGSFLLMGFSLSVSWHLQNYERIGLPLLVSHILLLIAWSWTGGFVVASVSRRTLWVSIASTFLPCLFCLARFRGWSLPRLCLLLFLVPAIWGVFHGLRATRIKLRPAIVLAVALTMLMIAESSAGLWLMNWLLIWPTWYLVATARRLPAL
jgi:hypothetical protein